MKKVLTVVLIALLAIVGGTAVVNPDVLTELVNGTAPVTSTDATVPTTATQNF